MKNSNGNRNAYANGYDVPSYARPAAPTVHPLIIADALRYAVKARN